MTYTSERDDHPTACCSTHTEITSKNRGFSESLSPLQHLLGGREEATKMGEKGDGAGLGGGVYGSMQRKHAEEL